MTSPKINREVEIPPDQAALILDEQHSSYSVEFGCFGVTYLRDYEKVLEISPDIEDLAQKKRDLQIIFDIMFA